MYNYHGWLSIQREFELAVMVLDGQIKSWRSWTFSSDISMVLNNSGISLSLTYMCIHVYINWLCVHLFHHQAMSRVKQNTPCLWLCMRLSAWIFMSGWSSQFAWRFGVERWVRGWGRYSLWLSWISPPIVWPNRSIQQMSKLFKYSLSGQGISPNLNLLHIDNFVNRLVTVNILRKPITSHETLIFVSVQKLLGK